MRLLARADASTGGGYGHVVRALAVLEQARARGHDVVLVGTVPPGWVHEELAALGVEHLAQSPAWADLATVARTWGADVVHVDDYRAPQDLRRLLAPAGALLVGVEDGTWGRRPADVVLDQTWGAEQTRRPDDGTPLLLRGADHVLVRSAVRRARLRRAVARAGDRDGRARLQVLVVMGGSDAAGALQRVVAAVAASGHELDVRAVGTPTTDAAALVALASARVSVTPLGPRRDLPDLLADADVVVSAAGTTATELCCIGAPSALLAVVDNQEPVLRAMAAAGVAVPLADVGDRLGPATALDALLAPDPSARDRLSRLAVAAVDGCGAARLLGEVEGRLADPALRAGAGARLLVREALPVDCALLLRWRNDAAVRRVSRQQGAVAPEDHLRWLTASLAADDRHLLVVEDAAATPSATVRWDRRPDDPTGGRCWEVSITLAPDQRGRRLSGDVLRASEHWLADREPATTTVEAAVHVDNPTSQALFRRAGYLPAAPADEQGFERFARPVRRRPR